MMTNKFMRKREKIRAQMKSRFYYWFWGAATVTVYQANSMLDLDTDRWQDH